MNTTLDKFKGCLVGLACGDALGGPVEAIPGPAKLPERKHLQTEMTGGGFFKLMPGQITDDTDMALCLATSLVEKKHSDPADVAKRYLAWYLDNPIGTGKTIETAMEALKGGMSWDRAAASELGIKSKGNGSLMRCAPIAMASFKHEKLLRERSYYDSCITHMHQDCIDAVVFVNLMIAAMLQGEDHLVAYIQAVDKLDDWSTLHFSCSKVLRMSVEERNRHPSVISTLLHALHSLLTTNSFEEALVKSVNLGGDADTIGAVTGALAGACYGERQIPERWKTALIDRHKVSVYPLLLNLSEQLFALANQEAA